MEKLTRKDLYSLEEYAGNRTDIRKRVLEHKQNRKIHIGPTATLYFEDRQTIQYQVQEMLRVERIFEATGIEEELGAYNPLIPDGSNWKATFMISIDFTVLSRCIYTIHSLGKPRYVCARVAANVGKVGEVGW